MIRITKIIFFILITSVAFSQSKKKQIEVLSFRKDSLYRVNDLKRNTNQQFLFVIESRNTELSSEILKLKIDIKGINESNFMLKQKLLLLTDEKNIQTKVVETKTKELDNLKRILSVKTDSLILVQQKLDLLRSSVVQKNISNSLIKTVEIGTQVWMTENLNVSTFRNGDRIPEAKSTDEWFNAAENHQPAWCYYNNDTTDASRCGKLYNWYAVNDPRGLAPEGWHIPSFREWEQLIEYLGGKIRYSDITHGANYYLNEEESASATEVIVSKLKQKEIITTTKIKKTRKVGGYYETKFIPCSHCSYWTEKQRENNHCKACQNKKGKYVKTGKYIPEKTEIYYEEIENKSGWNGTNESGFSALPTGFRSNCRYFYECSFYNYDNIATFWTSTLTNDEPNYVKIRDKEGTVSQGFYGFGSGMSVRCVKGTESQIEISNIRIEVSARLSKERNLHPVIDEIEGALITITDNSKVITSAYTSKYGNVNIIIPNYDGRPLNIILSHNEYITERKTNISLSDGSKLAFFLQYKSELDKPTFNNDSLGIKTTTIGEQIWMTQNLSVSTFRNGDTITEAKTKEDWQKAGRDGEPVWCYYDYDPKNGEKYGKLYNWFAVQDQRGLAPEGYHIPIKQEWLILTEYLGGDYYSAPKLCSTNGWFNNHGNNISGFSALPGGSAVDDYFKDIYKEGNWWTSSERHARSISERKGFLDDSWGSAYYFNIFGNGVSVDSADKSIALSVRCVKDLYYEPINILKTVEIGSQIWMADNLNVSYFKNGDPIPQVQTNEEWSTMEKNKQPAWCYNNNDPANGVKFGKLYNWYAVNDPRGLAPEGWHIPSNDEWVSLFKYLGLYDTRTTEEEDQNRRMVSSKMKSNSGWEDYYDPSVGKKISGNGNNDSGFSGQPAGYRTPFKVNNFDNSFRNIGYCGCWWSSTSENSNEARYRSLDYKFGYDRYTIQSKGYGFSVRCIKD